MVNKSTTNVGLKVHFSETSNWDVNNHYITLDNFGDSLAMDVKAERVYVTSKLRTDMLKSLQSLQVLIRPNVRTFRRWY